jgi:hypothetical protein
MLRQGTRAWTDFNHGVLRLQVKMIDNPPRCFSISQKILTQLSARQHAILIQYLANFPFRHAGKALLIQEIFQAPKKFKKH